MTENYQIFTSDKGKMVWASSHDKAYSYLMKTRVLDSFLVNKLPDVNLHTWKNATFTFPRTKDEYFLISNDTVRLMKNSREQYRFTVPALPHQRLFVLGGRLCYINHQGDVIFYEKEKPRKVSVTGALAQQRLLQQPIKVFWNLAMQQVFIGIADQCYLLQLMPDGTVHTLEVLNGFDFTGNAIVSMYYDENHHRLFLGSTSKGLYVCSRQQFRTRKAGNKNNEVYYAQAPYGNKGVLTANGVVFDSAAVYTVPLLSYIRKTGDDYSMVQEPGGNYWFKHENMLYRLNKTLTAIDWQQDIGEFISQLYLDKEGRLWIGGMKKGLYMIDTKAQVLQRQLYTPVIVDPAFMNAETPDVLWIGTAKGLFRLHLQDHRIDTLTALRGKYIRSIYIPESGEIWITTYGDGIFLYKNNRLTQLPIDRRQYLATAHCIFQDTKGYLWVTTNKGLFQFSRRDGLAYAAGIQQELFYMYYGKDQGFNTNEFNGGCEPCALQLGNGAVSLPSLDGLVYFDPAAITAELPAKGIFVDRVELDTKEVTAAQMITLQPDFRQLKIYVSSPYFGDPGNLQLYYSLNGPDQQKAPLWLPVNDEQTIAFASLPSGEYELHLRKVNGFGKQNTIEGIFRIVVLPAWYETTGFRILVAVILLLLVWMFYRLRLRGIQLKNRRLELHVAARTKALHETLENLELSEQQLRRQAFMQQRLLAAISHDIKTPLEFLVAVMGKSYQLQVDMAAAERDVAYESLQRMSVLIGNLIRYMKSQYRVNGPLLEIVDIYLLAEEKMHIFYPMAQARGVVLENDIVRETAVFINRQLLSVILHNLLDNAVKYTKKGKIRITSAIVGPYLLIELTDTGEGMPVALMDWINRFEKNAYDTAQVPFTHTGLGIMMVMELLQLIGGSILVSTHAPAGGTKIVLTMPVNMPGNDTASPFAAVH
ncbi:sensor histidine kinase [Chitinophaga nivalis]|uniref:histidine kinase n=1 Tax=Chitinophaga nivalis TaxID=2991709 RepID=A0ABT3IKH9_9BACT|nr:sensor histidine kinase [Chitinophaga nivalis]MCW3466040.1 ATP-binding protein [Chitinophaga nivalis]MCW3484269.1 ATP-binding protein [Chitinophaga nivalis]